MDRDVIRKMLDAVIQHVDYDIWKERFNEETVEYGQDAEANMDELIGIVEDVLEEN